MVWHRPIVNIINEVARKNRHVKRVNKNSRIFPVCTNKIKNAKIESIFRSQKLPTYIVYPVRSGDVFGVLSGHQIWGLVCRKHMRRAGTSNYTPQYLWGVITWPCTWYLLLAIRDPTVCRFRVYWSATLPHKSPHVANAQVNGSLNSTQ